MVNSYAFIQGAIAQGAVAKPIARPWHTTAGEKLQQRTIHLKNVFLIQHESGYQEECYESSCYP